MAHRFAFDSFASISDLLNEAQVQDFVEMFYRWGDSQWCLAANEKFKRLRGVHSYNPFTDTHTITLCRKNIVEAFEKKLTCGGNVGGSAPTLQVAAGFVLAHEIQHANQTKLHRPTDQFFYGKHRKGGPEKPDPKYWNRACEREARQFVDERASEICAYFGAPAPSMLSERTGARSIGDDGPELLAVADLIGECSEFDLEDVKAELRASGILNPVNVTRVLQLLREQEREEME
jgi:hypothetical protein